MSRNPTLCLSRMSWHVYLLCLLLLCVSFHLHILKIVDRYSISLGFLKKNSGMSFAYTFPMNAKSFTLLNSLFLSSGDEYPRYFNPRIRTRFLSFAVTAAGKGKLHLGMWCYAPYRKDAFTPTGYCGEKTRILRPGKSPAFELAPEPQEFKCVLTPPRGTGFVIPRIYTEDGSEAVVTGFRMRLLPRANQK